MLSYQIILIIMIIIDAEVSVHLLDVIVLVNKCTNE